MITKFKIFESINILPKVGDYVLIKIDKFGASKLQDFYSNNIGQITDFDLHRARFIQGENFYYIKFQNVEKDIIPYFDSKTTYQNIITVYKKFSINRFEYWSENKEDLEEIIKEKKYNL